jgi:hypothetical protein
MQCNCSSASTNMLGVGRTCLRQRSLGPTSLRVTAEPYELHSGLHDVTQHSRAYHASCWEDSRLTICSTKRGRV